MPNYPPPLFLLSCYRYSTHPFFPGSNEVHPGFGAEGVLRGLQKLCRVCVRIVFFFFLFRVLPGFAGFVLLRFYGLWRALGVLKTNPFGYCSPALASFEEYHDEYYV